MPIYFLNLKFQFSSMFVITEQACMNVNLVNDVHNVAHTGFLKMMLYYMSLVLRKPVFGVSDQVRHKLGCTATEDG